jgi:hypothetical protein
MTDLLTKLRNRAAAASDTIGEMCNAAADEIERLSKNQKELCPFVSANVDVSPHMPCPKCGMLGTIDAEDKCVLRGKK